MYRRLLLVLALLLAGPATMGAASAPGDPLSLHIISPNPSGIGRTTWLSVQVHDLTVDTRPELGSTVVLTLPAGLTFVSGPGPEDAGGCTAAGATVTCTLERFNETSNYLFWEVTVQVSADLPLGTRLTSTAVFGDLTTSHTMTVVLPVDLGVTVVETPDLPVTAGEPFDYSVVVHNYGPGTIDKIALLESFGDSTWLASGTINGGIDCPADSGSLLCELTHTLEPGEEIRIDHTVLSRGHAGVWGKKALIGIELADEPADVPNNRDNNSDDFTIEFAPKPSGPASPSPSVTTGAPGSLPITGPAPGTPVLAGAALLLAGTALLGAARLRRRRS